MNVSRNVLVGVIAGIIAVGSISLISSTSVAQMGGMSGGSMGGHDMGNMGGMSTMGNNSMSGMSGDSMGGMSGGSMGGMSGGSMGGMMGGSMGGMPGETHQMCQPAGDMPPHYCEPTYHVMSSVKGIEISKVTPMDDTEVMITLREIVPSDGVSQKLMIVGGSGNLAGGITVDAGWSESTMVHLPLTGSGTIYDRTGMHIHVFPYTG